MSVKWLQIKDKQMNNLAHMLHEHNCIGNRCIEKRWILSHTHTKFHSYSLCVVQMLDTWGWHPADGQLIWLLSQHRPDFGALI